MPRAEAGSTKAVSNQMKSKGLQRLRWYCQPCEKQCRDENGFKCHTQSEGHVRQMQLLGENPRKVINDYSNQFLADFVLQLRTGHGTKPVQINHFYQTFIADKHHLHMNSTKWSSLTEFAKHLGREGICRVEETEKGIHVAWIDNSPEALRRQDALRKKERMEKGDEEREQKLIQEQVEKAQREAQPRAQTQAHEEPHVLERKEGEKVKFSFGMNDKTSEKDKLPTPPKSDSEKSEEGADVADVMLVERTPSNDAMMKEAKPSLSLTKHDANKPKNVFAQPKKNPLASKVTKKPIPGNQPKKMSAMERIVHEETERKRAREAREAGGLPKKMRHG